MKSKNEIKMAITRIEHYREKYSEPSYAEETLNTLKWILNKAGCTPTEAEEVIMERG